MKFHLIEITINKGDLKYLLTKVKAKLFKIREKDKFVSFYIKPHEHMEFQDVCQKYRIEIINTSEVGILPELKKRKLLKTLMLTSSVFIMLSIYCSMFLWNIQITGNYTNTSDELKRFLIKNNIAIGMKKSKIDCDEIEKSIRNKYFDITWVCAEIKGTNLIVHINENYNKEIADIEPEPYDLIADCDCQIVSIITRAGNPQVKAGDTVTKGKVVIAGTVDVYNEFEEKLFTKYVKADGDIIAKYEQDYYKKYNKKGIKKKYSGKKSSRVFLNVFGNDIFRYRKKIKSDIICKEKKFSIFKNFYLPFSIYKEYYMPFEYEDVSYTDSELKDQAKKDLDYYLCLLEQKQYKIIENNVKIEIVDGNCIVSGKIICLKPLGVVAPISIQEEGTTINNERN